MTRYLPLTGWLVGAVATVVYWLVLHTVLVQGVTVIVSMGVTLPLTGVLREDGLVDCAGGFGDGYAPGDRLRIIRGSRIGTLGATVVCMALLLRWRLLSAMALHSISIFIVMVAAYITSRAVAANRLLTHDYMWAEGKAKSAAQRMRWSDVLWAGALGVVSLLWLGPMCATLTVVGPTLVR